MATATRKFLPIAVGLKNGSVLYLFSDTWAHAHTRMYRCGRKQEFNQTAPARIFDSNVRSTVRVCVEEPWRRRASGCKVVAVHSSPKLRKIYNETNEAFSSR